MPEQDSTTTRLIPLTRGKFAVVDAADFGWLSQWKWCAEYHKKRNIWYAVRTSKKSMIRMHRVIIDAPKGIKVDHADGDGLHNWRGNLRLATTQQNASNRHKQKTNTSGYKGVTWHIHQKKWLASIQVYGRSLHLGTFRDKVVAAHAYDAAARKHFKEFAKTNF